jgi:hypothetical protein
LSEQTGTKDLPTDALVQNAGLVAGKRTRLAEEQEANAPRCQNDDEIQVCGCDEKRHGRRRM